MATFSHVDVTSLKKRIDYALNQLPVDTLIKGAHVFNVFTQEFHTLDVGIVDGMIVSLGKDIQARSIIDATGKAVLSQRYQGGIPVAELQQGAYVLRIHGTSGPRHARFIKQ